MLLQTFQIVFPNASSRATCSFLSGLLMPFHGLSKVL